MEPNLTQSSYNINLVWFEVFYMETLSSAANKSTQIVTSTSNLYRDTLIQFIFTFALFYIVKCFFDIVSPNVEN